MSDDFSARFQKIESHLAHLEHQIEQINDVVIEQGKMIEQLRKAMQHHSATLETIELERVKSTNPKPPHWQP